MTEINCPSCGTPLPSSIAQELAEREGVSAAAATSGYGQYEATPQQGAAAGAWHQGQPGAAPGSWQQGAPAALPPQAGAAGSPPNGVTSEQRGWAMAAHLGGLGAGLVTAGFFGFVGPLFVWLLRRDAKDSFAEHHSKEALNFQLTVLMALIAGAVLAIPAVIVGVLTLGVGLLLGAIAIAAATAAWFILPIIATVRASSAQGYRYPFTIRFIR